MKKIVSLLLGCILSYSLVSCSVVPNDILSETESTDIFSETEQIPPETESTDIPPKTEIILPENKEEDRIDEVKVNPYGVVLDIYRQVLSACDALMADDFDIEGLMSSINFSNNCDKQLFQSLIKGIRPAYIDFYNAQSRGREVFYHFGYSRKDLNGDDGSRELVLLSDKGEIFAVFSNMESQPRLLWSAEDGKKCQIDQFGLIYTQTITFTDYGMYTDYCVSQINKGGLLEECLAFGEHLLTVGGVSDGAARATQYRYVNGKKQVIPEAEYEVLFNRYAASFSASDSNQTWDSFSYSFNQIFTTTDLAERALRAALDNQEMVYRKSSNDQEWYGCFLSALTISVYEGLVPLSEVRPIAYILYDMDRNGTREAVIEYNAHMVLLRYYQGAVYAYEVSGYSINNDGSYNCSFGMNSSGACKASFDGLEMKTTEVWRSYNREGRIEYYVYGKQVSMQQYVDFFKENSIDKVYMDVLQKTWINETSRKEAIGIGMVYWNVQQGDSVTCIQRVDAPASVYVIVVARAGSEPFDEIWVDKTTGSIFLPEDFSEEVFSEAEKAMAAYEAALKNEIMVYETDIGTFNYMKDCKTPYNRTPLSNIDDLKYVYMDMDGDTVNELVIDCGDILILRYYAGVVFVYPFTFRNMYHLNTDGSYSWNHTGQDFEYGESQLLFDGVVCKSREIWRIVNDGEPNAEYYIEGEKVSLEELLTYFENHPKTEVTFIPLELSMEGVISPEEAVKIADEYWGYVDGMSGGACGSRLVSRVVIVGDPTPLSPYYRVAWSVEYYDNSDVEGYEDGRPYFVEICKVVLVDIYTGECIPYEKG